MTDVAALVVGLLAGAHSATWGMYKDAIYEGFTVPKYLRSVLISAVVAVVVARLTALDVHRAGGLVILYGLTYVVERYLMEVYKTFLRTQDQGKYTIPMQFHVLGEVVGSRSVRWSLAALYVGGVLAVVFVGLPAVDSATAGWPPVARALLVGSVGGWIAALGGAWKDAPIEGFHLFKFFRSPLIALCYAVLIAFFTDNLAYIALCGVGYSVGTIETYKTFFFPNKPRGKFAGKEVRFPAMLAMRRRFVPLYAGIWAAVLVAYAVAFAQEGFSRLLG
jgi:hypothetical protein